MEHAKNRLSIYGSHRVLSPEGALPQSAKKLNNSPKLQSDFELSLDVDYLMLDATSMRQIREESSNDFHQISERILKIIQERGKMHNPVTNSGGVLVGRIREIGSRFFECHPPLQGGNKPGQVIVPVASLSTLPLHINKIKEVSNDRVTVEGSAIMFSCMRICPVPSDFTPELTLTCVDISSLVPQVSRCLEEIVSKKMLSSHKTESPIIRILVIGCGKAGVTALYCLRDRMQYFTQQYKGALHKSAPLFQTIAIDTKQNSIQWILQKKLADMAKVIDAKQTQEIYDFISDQTGGALCDLIINVVNVPGTETPTVLCATASGTRATILWFSMATQFDQAALATDSLGKDVTMIIGNGVAQSQVEDIVSLVNAHPDLRAYLEKH